MYQRSGLAEIVNNPSFITRKYLNYWFTGTGSFGKGLKLLGWPINEDSSPLLVWSKKDGLREDLIAEDKIMYSKTLFHYVDDGNTYILKIDYKKILSPSCIWGTLRAIWSQSKLIINYQKTYNMAKKHVGSIPVVTPKNKEDIELKISELVWPKVIAVDYIGEFIYSAMVNKLDNEEKIKLINKLQQRISPIDWYTKSILAWDKLKNGTVSEDFFLSEYGYSANDPYELTKPRYFEILNKSKPGIRKTVLENMKIVTLEDLYVGMQYLRSEAKYRSLIWISALRDVILNKKNITNQ